MEHDDRTAPPGAEWDQILQLWVAAEQALGASPDALRRLRVHCLRERSQLLLGAFEEQRKICDAACADARVP